MEEIIVYGGTFDPIHNGHLSVINYIVNVYKGAKLIIVPNNKPPHKRHREITEFSHRINMVKIAVKDIANVTVSYMEQSNDIHYALNTLNEIQKQFKYCDISLLIGSDMFLSLSEWYKYDEILKNYNIIIFARLKSDIAKVNLQIKDFTGKKITFIDAFVLEASSTEVRIDKSSDKIPLEIKKYIRENDLYK